MDAGSKTEWEEVIESGDYADMLERVRVPGGWLYRTSIDMDSGLTCAMCFVPDQAEATQRAEELTRKLREEWKEVLDDI